MPVPKRRTSSARRDKRSAGIHKVATTSAVCGSCDTFVLQHTVCQGCGFYKGIKVIRTKSEKAEDREVAKKLKSGAKNKEAAKQKIEAKKAAIEAVAQQAEAEKPENIDTKKQ